MNLAGLLDRLYAQYNRRDRVPPDPLQFVYRYTDRADQEVVAFLASGLAYGRVGQIDKDLTDLLARLGDRPAEAAITGGPGLRRRLEGFRHRFTTGSDVADLLEVLGWAIREAGSLESLFLRGHDPAAPTVLPALDRFCGALLEWSASRRRSRDARGLPYLLARPTGGSACKRLNLFLRWMVRRDQVDLGLWTGIDPSRLVVPMDVHMGRICRLLGLYQGRSVSMTTALQVTRGFAAISPADPVRYDFALSRIGIVGGCIGRPGRACGTCILAPCCAAAKDQKNRP